MKESKTKKKKKKAPLHAPYNQKEFLAKNSIMSMSAIHTRLLTDGTAIVRISDCHNSIKLWNDVNDQKQVDEMLEKLDTMIAHLESFRNVIAIKSHKII